mgnify:CR=1 FL=1
MTEESWKDIPGYEGRYQASTEGQIRSIDHFVNGKNPYTGAPFKRLVRGRVLRPGQFCKNGHMSVVLCHGAKGSPVHQLIMLTFVGPTPEGQEIRHKNGNPKDNRLCNLEFGTRTENILDVYYQGKRWRKLNIKEVREIRNSLSLGVSGAELARQYDVSQNCISKIKHGGTYSWLQ